MYIIIVGGGRTGSALAQRLSERGHNVVIIEKDEKRAHELASRLNTLVIHGNGAELKVLKDAGLEKADALVALTDADEVNLMACEIAKKQGVPTVIARVNDDAHAQMFESIGIDVAVSIPTTLSMLFEKVLLGGAGVYGLLSVGGGKGEVIEVKVGPNSKAVGKTLSELKLKDVVVATISRGDELIIPKGDTTIQPGDLVTIIGYKSAATKIARFLKGD
ncbi:MAG: FAD-dependent oxidoreductase [Candidatus Hadarchaeales archaeon]